MMYGWLRFCIALPSKRKEVLTVSNRVHLVISLLPNLPQSLLFYFFLFENNFFFISFPYSPVSREIRATWAIGAPVDPSHSDQWSGKPTVTRPVTYYMRPSFFSRPSSPSSVPSVCFSPRPPEQVMDFLRLSSGSGHGLPPMTLVLLDFSLQFHWISSGVTPLIDWCTLIYLHWLYIVLLRIKLGKLLKVGSISRSKNIRRTYGNL